MSQNNGYPFGVRQLMLHAISNLTTPTYGTGVSCPAINGVEYDYALSSTILKGEDRVIAAHTITDNGTFKFSGGGIPLAAHAIVEGETATDSGSSPNDLTFMRKKVDTCLPYFGAVVRAVGPSCNQVGEPADTTVTMFKCKLNKRPGGAFKEGAFATSDIEGIVLTSPYSANSMTLYLVQHRATAAALTTTWPGDAPFLS